MPKSLDLSSLTRAERVVLASALALSLNGFIPWWYRIAIDSGTYTYNAGLTGYGVIAVGAAMLAWIAILARTNIWPKPAPHADGVVYTLLGAVATGALLAQIARARGEWIGCFVALALAVVLTVAGALRSRERRAGWQ